MRSGQVRSGEIRDLESQITWKICGKSGKSENKICFGASCRHTNSFGAWKKNKLGTMTTNPLINSNYEEKKT